MYQTSREEHCRKLDSVWKNVESALQALSRAKGEQFTGAKTQLRASYECYQHATARYSFFLEKAKTPEARHELQLQQAIDEDREAIVSEKLREATPQERDKAHKTASQFSLSVHSRASSRSRRSGFSTISLAAVQARVHAEAVKARAQFGRKEAAMRLEKARIEAELEVLQHEKEAAAADAQASALEAAVEQDGGECVHPHPPLDRTLRVSSYITEQATIRDAELASLRAPVIHPRSQSLEHAKVTNHLMDLRMKLNDFKVHYKLSHTGGLMLRPDHVHTLDAGGIEGVAGATCGEAAGDGVTISAGGEGLLHSGTGRVEVCSGVEDTSGSGLMLLKSPPTDGSLC
ncbi:hypothetical protein HPB51_012891 [Rhipicephalus microplus]|uniref:Uncharacterized protein n=1 Tax=Rhipicephalus microplus TaxID=6941 RepID=A0A9J6EGC8_RHIMP|nr:hypothetical protein HPB51_012891 [Rhipicephalus microplus]